MSFLDPDINYDALYTVPAKKLLRAFSDINQEALEDLFALLRQGYRAGLRGWYKNLDYSSDAHYCNGPAREMARLEAQHGLNSETLFEFFTEAHTQGLADEHRLIYVMLRNTGSGVREIVGVRDSPMEIRRLQVGVYTHGCMIEAHVVQDRALQEASDV